MKATGFFDPLARTVTRNLLKHAAGQAIFCPLCDHVMDWKRTVIITVGNVTKACCAQCWDATLRPSFEKHGILNEVDVVDGRTL